MFQEWLTSLEARLQSSEGPVLPSFPFPALPMSNLLSRPGKPGTDRPRVSGRSVQTSNLGTRLLIGRCRRPCSWYVLYRGTPVRVKQIRIAEILSTRYGLFHTRNTGAARENSYSDALTL
jgi:hypothetical protein